MPNSLGSTLCGQLRGVRKCRAHTPDEAPPDAVVLLVLQLFAAPDVPLVHVAYRRVARIPARAAVRRAAVVRDGRVGKPGDDVGKDLLIDDPSRERVDACRMQASSVSYPVSVEIICTTPLEHLLVVLVVPAEANNGGVVAQARDVVFSLLLHAGDK